MKKIINILMLLCIVLSAQAQRVLSLDSCRSLALRNNKQLNISRVNRYAAESVKKAAHTKYLPKVDATGSYQFTSREISVLNKGQKNALDNFGSNVGTQVGNDLSPIITELAQKGIITPTQAQTLGGVLQQAGISMTSALNEAGSKVKDAFRTNTRNLFAADVLIRQPIYMGGAITAANRIAKINIDLAENNIEGKRQATLFDIDQAYWLVVSLRQKQMLADQYLELVKKFDDDVLKMLKQGVTTKADELRVAVRVNEAEMTKTQVDDGLVLARMHLCQLCGLNLNEDIQLEDEDRNDLDLPDRHYQECGRLDVENRPELKILQNTIDISRQNTIVTRAVYLPQVVAVGGYFMSNPNLLNGFEHKFSGLFHIGVAVRVPVWSWHEGRYKTRATKAATTIAEMELADAREKMQLQVSQSNFRIKEANKKLVMATRNQQSAEENLRCAQVGFREGVMQTTDVMAAQTAWMNARSQKIDAEIDVKMSHVNLEKALGTLHE
ncbi:MAG: TolC family protein [Prevotella sp.]|jgi:outer membrane protein TolC|nr:TolC family protein [Prevotella sp.]MCI2081544.1 TolC family protein [Prevotella sp.]MCI2103411.1 TolC family protein [Prevotella sp.]